MYVGGAMLAGLLLSDGLTATDAKAAHTLPKTKAILDVLAYADGKADLIDISTATGIALETLYPIVELLEAEKLLKSLS